MPSSTNAGYITATGGSSVIIIHERGTSDDSMTIVFFLPISLDITGLTKLARRLPIANADSNPPATL